MLEPIEQNISTNGKWFWKYATRKPKSHCYPYSNFSIRMHNGFWSIRYSLPSHFVRLIADGTPAKVTGIGSSIQISSSLYLELGLFVPKLKYNLLSATKLNKNLNYEFVRTWYHGIWWAKLNYVAGLYLLKATGTPLTKECNKLVVWSNCESTYIYVSLNHSNKDNLVMMLHYCLGHPNFVNLERLFFSLFLNKKSQIIRYEICQLSKHVLFFHLILNLHFNLSILSTATFGDLQG